MNLASDLFTCKTLQLGKCNITAAERAAAKNISTEAQDAAERAAAEHIATEERAAAKQIATEEHARHKTRGHLTNSD